MANNDHVVILERSAEEWNRWREANPDVRPDLRCANLSRRTLRNVDFRAADLTGSNLSGSELWANFDGANLTGADLSHAVLNRSTLERAILMDANLQHAKLRGVTLRGANLGWADLLFADLSPANLTEEEYERDVRHAKKSIAHDPHWDREVMKRAVEYGIPWEEERDFTAQEFAWSFKKRTRLDSAILEGCDLSHALLPDCDLTRTRLRRAVMRGVDFHEADLSDSNADGADFTGADLTNAKMERAKVTNAVFRRTKLFQTFVAGVDFSTSECLTKAQTESVNHMFDAPVWPKRMD
jgi:uncharacterized protein YjbI with pentapeptide repeats